jgi:hypothetical protein
LVGGLVGWLGTMLSCAKTAERIELTFIPKTGMDHRYIVLDWGPDPPKSGGVLGGNRGILDIKIDPRRTQTFISSASFNVEVCGFGRVIDKTSG